MQNESTYFDTYLSAKLVDINQLKGDSERLRVYSKYYTEHYSTKGLAEYARKHGPKSFDSPDAIAMHCIPHTMVVMYARMFDKSSKRKPTPYTLDEGIFKAFENLRVNHKQIIDQRNKYFAHDENYFNMLPKFSLEVVNNRIEMRAPTKWYTILSCPDMECDVLEPILDVIDNFLDLKYVETLLLFKDREVNLIDYNLESIKGKIKENIAITEKDVRNWKGKGNS